MEYEFLSNPPLPERVKIEPLLKDGKVVNQVVRVPGSNRSELESIHYSAETMSLRAKLNLGVPLSKVSLGAIENDPNYLNGLAVQLERNINLRLRDLDVKDNNNLDSE